MDQIQIVREFLRMVRRRSLILCLGATLGVVAASLYALSKPELYETSATIQVESQQIPDNLARSTVDVSAAERLQIIEQRLMSRDNILAVINRLGLFLNMEGNSSSKIELLRQAIRIETISAPGLNQGNSVDIFAFTITARLGDPRQAAAIIDQFVESALEQNRRARADRTRTTLDFFENEEDRVATAIANLEEEIAEFKNDNENALPESLQFRYDELARLQDTDLEIDSRILDLETVLAGGRPLSSGEPTPRSPEETALRQLALELAQKRRVLGPTHPTIGTLQDRMAAIAEIASTYSADPTAILPPSGGANEAQRSSLRRQTDLLTDRVAQLEAQKEELASRREALQASIRETSSVEIALNALNRRLLELQNQYSVIVQRRAEARTGEALEAGQQSERFEVVETAAVPEHPIEPNRKKIVVLGSGASVGLAFGFVLLLEMLNPVIRTSAAMERQLNLRPVISIPYVATSRERRRNRVLSAIGLVLLTIGLAFALEVVDEHVIPLASIGEAIGERIGLGNVVEAFEARF